MSETKNTSSLDRISLRRQQAEQLQANEAELGRLSSEDNREEFFSQITRMLGPLKDYIKRRLRIAYLDRQLQTEGVYTSNDILDEAILAAYKNFNKKPQNVSLEQWLYQLANQKLEGYLKRASARDARRRSLELFTDREEGTLEERITADAEGEIKLEEDLEDTEYHLRPEFTPPATSDNPEHELERKEERQRIFQALSRIPECDRIVFELSAVEGFSDDEISKITDVPKDEVSRIVERVKAYMQRTIQSGPRESAA